MSDKMEGHILNLYEDLDMTFRKLRDTSHGILNGFIDGVEEKMDGQNLTFTVRDGRLLIFGKRMDKKILSERGAVWETIDDNYSEITREGFRSAYFVIESHIKQFSDEIIDKVFKNGKIVIESAMITPDVPVTIKYRERYVKFIRPFSPFGEDTSTSGYREAYNTLAGSESFYIDNNKKTWSVGPKPILSVSSSSREIDKTCERVNKEVFRLIDQFSKNLSLDSTFEDYATMAVSKYIEKYHHAVPKSILEKTASRISKKRKGHFGLREIKKEFPENYKEIWKEIKKIEKNEILVLTQSILGLESLIQKISSLIFDHLDFQLSTKRGQVQDLKREVAKIKSAHKEGRVKVLNTSTGSVSNLSEKWEMKLSVAISRTKEIQILRKPVEGIVFTIQTESGQVRRKLTGMFTAVHRLTGLFKFPLQSEKLIVV